MRLHPAAWAAALVLALAAQAQATTVTLAADQQWHGFTIDAVASQSQGVEWIDADNSLDPGYGSPLSFAFTVAAGRTARLTVVDLAFAGDRFSVTNNGALLGDTSDVPGQDVGSAPFEFDPDAALGTAGFSSATFTLGSGSYLVTGSLLRSVLDDAGAPLNATAGALRLSPVSPIPEPDTVALYALGALAMAAVLRRRSR